MNMEIGEAAGRIWKILKADGETPVTRLKKKSGLPLNHFYMGLGWLAREDKLVFRRDKRNILVSLK
jgi:Winged helix-turn-helix domain (DUF2582)